MNRILAFGLLSLLMLAFSFSSAFSEETTETKIPPRVQKWFEKQISFDAKGWELDTCIAVCKVLTGADIMFEIGTDASKFPKITYRSDQHKFLRVLDALLDGTKFNWHLDGERIIIGKRQL